MTKKKKVCGIGINDADYNVEHRIELPKVNGKRVRKTVWTCPYYTAWKNMLQRCYSKPYLKRNPSYVGCTVCPEWLYFMTFKAWMVTQDFDGKCLDKDIIFDGNKIYNPENCRFVSALVNSFLLDANSTRGEFPLGVYWNKLARKFMARCSNPFTKKYDYLGYFICPNEAHLAWKTKKHEHACSLADLQTDQDIAKALRLRFSL